jgi:hypothetical protein
MPRPVIRRSILASILLALSAGHAQAQAHHWGLGVGAGMAVDVAGTDQEVDAVGIATEATLIRRASSGIGYGLQWDGAWFDGRFATEKRMLLAAVVALDIPGGPVAVHLGPGLGLVTVVDVDFPDPGTVGDGVISIGDEGTWGALAGVSARFPLGRAALAPVADVTWIRTRAHDVATLVLGARLTLGG